jgi:hypothetical protein
LKLLAVWRGRSLANLQFRENVHKPKKLLGPTSTRGAWWHVVCAISQLMHICIIKLQGN